MIWQLEQLSKLHDTEPETVEAAVNKAISEGHELCEKVVIGAYLDEQISLSKAAELLEVHPLELREKFQSRGIPVKVGVEDEHCAVAEAKAYRRVISDAHRH